MDRDTVLPADASTNTVVGVIVPAEGNVPPSGRSDREARFFAASWSAATHLVVHRQGGTALSNASLAFDRGQWRFRSEPESLEFADLQTVAEKRDSQMFAQLARAMKWQNRPADELIRAIDLALAMEMVPLARRLVEEGKRMFSNERRFQRLATVLAPPVILGGRQSQLTGLKESQQWLREHASEYRNQWVAVKGGNLLGTALTLKELHEKIGAEGKTLGTIIVKVLPDGAL